MTQTETGTDAQAARPTRDIAPHQPQPPRPPHPPGHPGGHPLEASIPVSASGRPQPDPGAVEAARPVNPATLRLRRRDPWRALSQAIDDSKKDANALFRKFAEPEIYPIK